jgi:hypothetical protein
MEWMFGKDRLFNWTPNPERPGVGDALVFMLKNAILGAAFVSAFASFGHPVIGLLVWAAVIEEQAMVTWMKNADSPVRAAVFFRLSLIFVEYLLTGLPAGAFGSVVDAVSHLWERLLPTVLHLGMLVLGVALMQRHVPWFRIWLVCAVCHLAYNSAIEYVL